MCIQGYKNKSEQEAMSHILNEIHKCGETYTSLYSNYLLFTIPPWKNPNECDSIRNI